MPYAAISTVQAQLDAQRLAGGSFISTAFSKLEIAYGGPQRYSRGAEAGSPTAFEDLIHQAAQKHDLDPRLIKAVIRTESNFNPNAVSHAGAKGLMQIMDFNSRAMGVRDPFDPAQNIEAGSKILRGQLDKYGDLPKALAAYNAGGPSVDKYGGIPPFRETQAYVARVIDALRGYTADTRGGNEPSSNSTEDARA